MILIVDDDPIELIMLEDWLSHFNYQCIPVVNMELALHALNIYQDKITLIIADIFMLGGTGYDFCLQVKADNKYKNIPFLFNTNTFISQADEQFALSLGADKFIRKDEGLQSLLESVRELLKEKE